MRLCWRFPHQRFLGSQINILQEIIKMEFKSYIEDPETMVCLQVHLTSGGKMFANMPVKDARITMAEWNKYVIYSSTPVEKRDVTNPPFFFYHLLEGDLKRPETLKPRLSFLFQNVLGMQYDELNFEEDKKIKELHERGVKATEVLAKAAEKHNEELDEGEEWRKKDGE